MLKTTYQRVPLEMTSSARPRGVRSFGLWRIVSICILASVVSDMLNVAGLYVFGKLFLGPLIVGLSWILLAALVYWMLTHAVSLPLALFLLVVGLKWAYYAAFLGQFNFQKDILVVPLFILAVTKERYLQERIFNIIQSSRMFLLVLFLLTFVPFIGRYSVYEGAYRFSSIWPWPQCPAYYLLAFMILFPKKRVILITILFGMIIYTGAKSAIIGGSLYWIYVLACTFRSLALANQRRLAALHMVTLAVAACVFIGVGASDHVCNSIRGNFSPLIEMSVTDSRYGHGRIHLNEIVLESWSTYKIHEMMLGTSTTSLYDAYEVELGQKNWPHNDPAIILFTYGIVGVSFYLYYLCVFPLVKCPHKDKPRLLILLAVIVILMLTNGFYPYHSHWLFLCAYGVICHDNRRARSNV